MIDDARTLVTGFTSFGRFAENPSAKLAAACGRRFQLIEVAYAAADAFLASLDPASFDRLLMLGVAGDSVAVRVERVARNVIGATPDVRGVVPARRVIEPAAPPTIGATLWSANFSPPAGAVFSENAGEYLCNYLFFSAMQRFGEAKRVGFVHVPPLEAMDAGRQLEILNAIFEKVEASAIKLV